MNSESTYLTVLLNDLPASVVMTECNREAVAITTWLIAGELGAGNVPRSKRRRYLQPHEFRCRRASLQEIAAFQAANISWENARLAAILL